MFEFSENISKEELIIMDKKKNIILKEYKIDKTAKNHVKSILKRDKEVLKRLVNL